MAGIYEVELSDGRIVELESDNEPDEQSVLAALAPPSSRGDERAAQLKPSLDYANSLAQTPLNLASFAGSALLKADQPQAPPQNQFSLDQYQPAQIPRSGDERAAMDEAGLNQLRASGQLPPLVAPPTREQQVMEETWNDLSFGEKLLSDVGRLGRGTISGIGKGIEGVGTFEELTNPPPPMGSVDARQAELREMMANTRSPEMSERLRADFARLGPQRAAEDPSARLASSPIVQRGRSITAAGEKVFPTIQPESVDRPLGAVLEGVGSSAPILLAGVATSGAGVIPAAAATEFQDAFDREIARQKREGEKPNYEKALYKSAGYAAVSSGIEQRLGVGRLIRNAGKRFGAEAEKDLARALATQSPREAIKEFAARRLRDVGPNALDEGLQRLAQDMIVEGKPEWGAIFQEAAVGGVSGPLTGAVLDAPGTAIQMLPPGESALQGAPLTQGEQNALPIIPTQAVRSGVQESVHGEAQGTEPVQSVRTDEARSQEAGPEIATQLGVKWDGQLRDKWTFTIQDGPAKDAQIGVPANSSPEVIKQRILNKQAEFMPETENGERLVELVKPDGTSEVVAYKDQTYEMGDLGTFHSIARPGTSGWSHGMAPPGSTIRELGQATAAPTDAPTPPTTPPNETTQETQAPGVLTGSAQPTPVLGASFNPPAAGRSGLEKAQAPPGQTLTGPVQEREATAPSRSTLGKYDYSVQTESARQSAASDILTRHRGDFDGAYRDVAQIDDSAYRAVATSALLEQELEKMINSNVADRLQIEQGIRKLSSDLKMLKTGAGQALQSEQQVNRTIGPYMALLSYMDLIRIRNPEATTEETIRSDPTAQKLVALAAKAKKAPEGIVRNKVYQEMVDILNSLDGISVSDLLRDVWYGSVLARAGTMLNVLAGGYATGALFTLSSSLGATVTGNPRLAIQMIGQFLGGTYEAALVAKEIVVEGNRTLLPDFAENAEKFLSKTKGSRKDSLEILWKRGGLTAAYPGVLAYTRRLITALDYIGALGTRDSQLIFTALARGDQESLNAIQKRFDKTENRKAETQAKEEMGTGASRAEVLTRKREILEEGVSKEVKAGALEIARRVAANAEPRGITKVIYDMIAKMPFFARAPLGLGFIRAAMNMVANSAEFYPVIGGITAARAELFARLPEGHPLKAFGFDLPVEQRRLVMANQALGLGVTGLLAAMFLGGDDDEGWELSGNWLGLSPAQSKALRDKGEKPYAIRFGKKGPWIVYKQLPIAGPLAIIGNMRDQKRFRNKEWSGQSAGEQITSAWLSGLVYIKDLSALSGLTRIFGGEAGRTQEKPETLARKANMMVSESAGRFASGYIPSLLKEIDEFMDPKLYRPRMKGDVSGFWLRNVPFARRTVGEGPDLNIFGDPVNVGKPPLRAWIGVEKDGPLWEAIGRLTSEGVFPPIPGRTATVVTSDGERRQMTEKEFYDYQSKWGKEFKTFVEERIEDFSTATPEEAGALYDAFRDTFGPVIRSQVTVRE